MSKWCGGWIATEKKPKPFQTCSVFTVKLPSVKMLKFNHFAFSLIKQLSKCLRVCMKYLAVSSVHMLTNPSAASLSDPAHLYEVHPRSGHHDLFWWTDPQPDADAQRWLRPTHRLGVHFCQPAAAHRDGWHGDRAPERHLSHIRRWASRGGEHWALRDRRAEGVKKGNMRIEPTGKGRSSLHGHSSISLIAVLFIL